MSDHIRIGSEGDHVTLTIDDYELFDYVEDCFTEQWSLEYSYMSEAQERGRNAFTMHFSPTISRDYVSRALDSLPAEEIERIWQLNNP
jgi:hypothetical protein